MAKNLMIQGTGSSVGKSLIVAGLCRILKNAGYRVAPFKAQNMSLNSFVTAAGGEMGRAQVVQAEACGIEPSVLMNPILIKPTGDSHSQVIVMGKVYQQLGAEEYYHTVPELVDIVRQAYQELASQYDIIVMEGAGSPAEINLRHRDLVNMGMAHMVDAPVILVGDIDKGGVFASLFGTVALMPPEDQKRVKAVIINKFRGSVRILEPGIKQLEQLMQVPCLGVVPYVQLNIDEEDGAVEFVNSRKSPLVKSEQETIIAVIRLPHISNFTDFDVFSRLPGTKLVYANQPSQLEEADLIILPGSKNTIGDLNYLSNSGFAQAIVRHYQKGGFVIGICGGYQMLGQEIRDPYHTESTQENIKGLGLLDIVTTFAPNKITTQVQGHFLPSSCRWTNRLIHHHFQGYEIHMGLSKLSEKAEPLVGCVANDGRLTYDGTFSSDGRVMGSYVHGLFDHPFVATEIVNYIRRRQGMEPIACEDVDYLAERELEYQRWAEILASSIDMDKVFEIIGG